MKHKFKIGNRVQHIDYPTSDGIIVDLGYLGQMENTEKDYDLNEVYNDSTDTFVESEEEFYQPWYRIMWDTTNEMFDLGMFVTESGLEYNGQESEGVLRLLD